MLAEDIARVLNGLSGILTSHDMGGYCDPVPAVREAVRRLKDIHEQVKKNAFLFNLSPGGSVEMVIRDGKLDITRVAAGNGALSYWVTAFASPPDYGKAEPVVMSPADKAIMEAVSMLDKTHDRLRKSVSAAAECLGKVPLVGRLRDVADEIQEVKKVLNVRGIAAAGGR